MAKKAIVLLEGSERLERAVADVRSAGFEARTAADARDLCSKWEADEPDVIVLDGPFSAMSGVELIRALRRARVQTPVVFLCESKPEADSLDAESELRPYCATQTLDSAILETLVSPRPAEEMDAALEGSLEQIALSEILLSRLRTGWTGRLLLEAGGTSKTLYFDGGLPVYCSSNILSENFGQMLLRKGVISEIDYEWARRLQVREGIRQGEALVKIGVLGHQDLFGHLRDQIREKIVNAFGWQSGSYRLEQGRAFLHNVTRFGLNPIDLIIAGVERFLTPDEGLARWGRMRHLWAVAQCDSAAVSASVRRSFPTQWLESLREPQLLADLALELGWSRVHACCVFSILHEATYLRLAVRPEELPPAQGTDLVAEATLDSLLAEAEGPSIARTKQAEKLSDALWKAYLRFSSADFFDVLGLRRTAADEEVTAARDELLDLYSSARFEPILDELPNVRALEAVQDKIALAAEVLLHEERRREYVESLPDSSERARLQVLSAEDEFQAGMSTLEVDAAKAHRHFSRALALNPEEPLYMLYCGWSRYSSSASERERAEAKRLMSRSIASDPALDPGYVLLARAYLREGNREEAAEQARTALAFNPTNREARALLDELGAEK